MAYTDWQHGVPYYQDKAEYIASEIGFEDEDELPEFTRLFVVFGVQFVNLRWVCDNRLVRSATIPAWLMDAEEGKISEYIQTQAAERKARLDARKRQARERERLQDVAELKRLQEKLGVK